jgi:glutathione S-transferase
VLVPVWMPKPDLMPLTGGYRRAPVMQIGADVYCDTQLILRVLERLHPEPSLFPGGTQRPRFGAVLLVGSNTFVTAARVLGAMIGDKIPPELVEDRKTFLGFDMGKAAMAPGLPLHVQRLRAHFHWLAQMFADGRPFALGAEPSAFDLSAYHIIWLLRRNIGAEIDALVPFARLQGWYERVGAIGHGSRSDMAAAEALDAAAGATPAAPDIAAEDGKRSASSRGGGQRDAGRHRARPGGGHAGRARPRGDRAPARRSPRGRGQRALPRAGYDAVAA